MGGPADLNGYRFIHQKHWLPRVYESMMTECIKPFILSKVSKYQLGGIPNSRPEEHLYTAKTLLNMMNKMGTPAWVSAFDMSKFFDRPA